MSQSTNNTQLLITIGAFTAFIAVSKWFKSQNEAPRPEMKASIQADMTLAELKQYDGEVKPEIFLALKGVIYDVSSSDFYRKPGGYSVFAGHDASICLAKMTHDESQLNQLGKIELSKLQQQSLDAWVARFQEKYPVVGKVKDL